MFKWIQQKLCFHWWHPKLGVSDFIKAVENNEDIEIKCIYCGLKRTVRTFHEEENNER